MRRATSIALIRAPSSANNERWGLTRPAIALSFSPALAGFFCFGGLPSCLPSEPETTSLFQPFHLLGNREPIGGDLVVRFLDGSSRAQIMYRSPRLLHERALNGTPRAVLGVLARALAHRTGPQVKLH